MEVIKRDGRREIVQFDKITTRIKNLCSEDDLNNNLVEPILIAQKTIANIYSGISTEDIDKISSLICESLIGKHYKYSELGAKICISNLHKTTSNSFYETTNRLVNELDKDGNNLSICPDYYKAICKFNKELDDMIDYNRDYNFNYFGFKTLEHSYLFKINGKIYERPQHLIMRVSVCIHMMDLLNEDEKINKRGLEYVKNTYDYISNGYFTHATPTLFNSGLVLKQLSSCFLLGTEDSIEGIYETLKHTALISKVSGGIGLHISNIRATKSKIRKTNGESDGIIPMLKVYNETGRYVNQGGGKRNGSIAIYLEPWHPDILDFLDIKKNTGSETRRARDIFTALWIPDIFMKRLESNGVWSLMCPDKCKGLSDTYGEEFEKLYEKYEREKKYNTQVKALDVWNAILESQFETGVPYICFKDNVNKKNNQINLGTIKSSNLCAEINEYSNENETAVCNLASIAVNKYIKDGVYDYNKLYEVVKQVTINLNKIIDINYYPTKQTKYSNLRNRPIGIGIQGLADAYIILRYPFDSNEALELNRSIMETIYYAALSASNEIAMIDGPYETYEGSPVSKGILQCDMWNVKPSNRWDWEKLRENVKKYGVRNSLLTALMPTASTSQILGNNECFEPITSNIYTRRTKAGTFTVVNKYLIDDLCKLKLWDEKMKEKIVYYNGSIQSIPEIPNELKQLYKTVWEIKLKSIVDQAIARGPYIDQSQSMNLFLHEPDTIRLTSALYYGWKKGLKTGSYYVRIKPAAEAQKVIDTNIIIEEQLQRINKNTNIKEAIDTIKENDDNTTDLIDEEIKVCPLIRGRPMTAEEIQECMMCSS